jgi:uncharacterized integral membrane protein
VRPTAPLKWVVILFLVAFMVFGLSEVHAEKRCYHGEKFGWDLPLGILVFMWLPAIGAYISGKDSN